MEVTGIDSWFTILITIQWLILLTYIYMNIVVNFDVEICIPQCNCCSKINLRLGRQFKVPFNMVLLDNKKRLKIVLNTFEKLKHLKNPSPAIDQKIMYSENKSLPV